MDFAKIFTVDGIGQILVTLDENDNGVPCVTFRIPDAFDCIMTTSRSRSSGDYDDQEAFARKMFDSLDEDEAVKSVQVLVAARHSFLGAAE